MCAHSLLAVSIVVGERVAGGPAAVAGPVPGRQILVQALGQPPHDNVDYVRGLAQGSRGVPPVHQRRHVLVVAALLRVCLQMEKPGRLWVTSCHTFVARGNQENSRVGCKKKLILRIWQDESGQAIADTFLSEFCNGRAPWQVLEKTRSHTRSGAKGCLYLSICKKQVRATGSARVDKAWDDSTMRLVVAPSYVLRLSQDLLLLC